MTFLLALQGAYAIDMHFSASDGGGRTVSIWDSYDVDDSVEVYGESSACFDDLSMDDSRWIDGPGNVDVIQRYFGSGGYVGMNYIYVEDALRTQTHVAGSAHLTPDTLSADQDVSVDGALVSAVVSTGDLDGMNAMQHANVLFGSLDSRQTIEIDGNIETTQDSQLVGYMPMAFGTAGEMDAAGGPGTLNFEGEGAAVGVIAGDLSNRRVPAEVDCRLATGAGNSAWSYGNIRSASSASGGAVAAAGAGNINIDADWTGGIPGLYIDGDAEGAGIGIGAIGKRNAISGTIAARTNDLGTGVYGENIEAFSRRGAAGTAAGAGNVEVDFIGGTTTGEGSAVGAGGLGLFAHGGADYLVAESGDTTYAAGKSVTGAGSKGAGAGAIAATYDPNGPGSGWEIAYVEGDTTGAGFVSGDFSADTSNSATARAKNLAARGRDVHLESYGDDGTSSSLVETDLSGRFVDGRMMAYAGDSTKACQSGHMWGRFTSVAEAFSSNPVDVSLLRRNSDPGYVEYDLKMGAKTDANGAHTKGKVGWYVDDDRRETIQGAVNAAWDWDKINVKEGTYRENVKIDKSLDVEGAGADKTIVDGGGVDRTFVVGENDNTVEVTLSDMTIQNGYADKTIGCGGGGGVKNYADLTIRNALITNNEADCGGGGIKNQDTGTLKIVNSEITGNVAGKGGGGIANNGLLLVKDSEITANKAGASGGGIANCGGNATVKNSKVADNVADKSGGGIKNDYGYLEVIDTTVSGNTAGKGGGGIKNYEGTTVVRRSDVIDNFAGTGGGGINNDGGNLTVRNSKVSDNYAQKGGGGISNCDSTGTVLVKNSEITNNEAEHCGGGLKNGGEMTIVNSLIADNEAWRGGGGIKNEGADANLTVKKNSKILRNSAGHGGGGIDNMGGTARVIQTSYVMDNTAGYCGGGLKNGDGGTLIVKESTISGNTAERGGGGIKNGDKHGSGTLRVFDSVITNNEAGYGGGGIDNMNGTAKVTRTDIIDNIAGCCGGGIKNGGNWSTATLTVKDCLIKGNVAEQSGGGIKNKDGSHMDIEGTIITGNTAYGCLCDKLGGGIRNDGTMMPLDDDTFVFGNNPNDIEGV